jgi:hypothetical protein
VLEMQQQDCRSAAMRIGRPLRGRAMCVGFFCPLKSPNQASKAASVQAQSDVEKLSSLSTTVAAAMEANSSQSGGVIVPISEDLVNFSSPRTSENDPI